MRTPSTGTALRCGPAISVAMAASPTAAQVYDHMGMWDGRWGWGHMAVGGLLMLLFWGGLILLVALFLRWLVGAGPGERVRQSPRASALEILEERFARGEIEREDFEERRRILLTGRADRRGRTG